MNGTVREPNPAKQMAAAMIAVGAVALAAGVLVWLAYLAWNGSFGRFPEEARPELYRSWRWFNWFAAQGGWLGKALAGLFAIISYGSQFLAKLHRRLGTVLAVAGICIAGVVASVVLMAEIDSGENLGILRSFTKLTDEEYALQVRLFLAGAIVWFIAFLGTQLGISWKWPAGALREWLAR